MEPARLRSDLDAAVAGAADPRAAADRLCRACVRLLDVDGASIQARSLSEGELQLVQHPAQPAARVERMPSRPAARCSSRTSTTRLTSAGLPSPVPSSSRGYGRVDLDRRAGRVMTGRERNVVGSLVSLAGSMVAGKADVVELLSELTADCARLLDVAAAGLLLADDRAVLHVMAASSESVAHVEALQIQRAEGPSLDCFHGGRPVSAPDLERELDRWRSSPRPLWRRASGACMRCRCGCVARCSAHSVCSVGSQVR